MPELPEIRWPGLCTSVWSIEAPLKLFFALTFGETASIAIRICKSSDSTGFNKADSNSPASTMYSNARGWLFRAANAKRALAAARSV